MATSMVDVAAAAGDDDTDDTSSYHAPPSSRGDAAEDNNLDPFAQDYNFDYDEYELDEARLCGLAAWATWTRDSVPVQFATWLVASAFLYVGIHPTRSKGVVDWWVGSDCVATQLLVSWAMASILFFGWASGLLQLVFTFEQRAMTFPRWSILVFVMVKPPVVGSVVYFAGADGRGYVRRVSAIQPKGIRTVGDIPGSPEDRPLYSRDGSAEWLDLQFVRGTMVAGPLPYKVSLTVLVLAFAASPVGTLAFVMVNQPLMFIWIAVSFNFCYYTLVQPVA